MSKHTEGAKDKMLRPNGLPESLIRYDGIYISFPKKKKINSTLRFKI